MKINNNINRATIKAIAVSALANSSNRYMINEEQFNIISDYVSSILTHSPLAECVPVIDLNFNLEDCANSFRYNQPNFYFVGAVEVFRVFLAELQAQEYPLGKLSIETTLQTCENSPIWGSTSLFSKETVRTAYEILVSLCWRHYKCCSSHQDLVDNVKALRHAPVVKNGRAVPSHDSTDDIVADFIEQRLSGPVQYWTLKDMQTLCDYADIRLWMKDISRQLNAYTTVLTASGADSEVVLASLMRMVSKGVYSVC